MNLNADPTIGQPGDAVLVRDPSGDGVLEAAVWLATDQPPPEHQTVYVRADSTQCVRLAVDRRAVTLITLSWWNR